jgi:cyclase
MAPDPALTPRVAKIAEGIHVRLAVDNIAWIDLGDGILVIDALEQPELEEEVFAAIASTAGAGAGVAEKPVRYVLNTHGHYDHTALNEAFVRRWQAQVISQPSAALPKEGRWFEGPRRKVLMQPLPGCHTAEDCIVWAPGEVGGAGPGERILFVGDIFGWGLIPSTRLDDKTARVLVAGYERLIAMDPAVVVPGHGPLCGPAELKRWIVYFRWLVGQVLAAVAAGKSESDIRAAVRPPDDMKSWWRFAKWKHEDSVTRVMAAVRNERLTAVPRNE